MVVVAIEMGMVMQEVICSMFFLLEIGFRVSGVDNIHGRALR